MAITVRPVFSQNEPQCSSRFDYEYKVVQKLVDLENDNKEQKQINEKLMIKNLDLQTEIDNIKNGSKEAITTLQNECKEANQELKSALEVASNALQSLTIKVGALTGQRTFYGFSAHESTSSAVRSGETIVFRQTRLNEGNAYNTGTSHFTIPVDGIYIFHATICIRAGRKYIYVSVMAGEKVIGRVVTSDTVWNLCTSGSALARLQKGTNVSLRVTGAISGSVLHEDSKHTNSFSGFLVGM